MLKAKYDTHHIFYPERDYTTSIEMAFRNLEENKVTMSMYHHQLLHKFSSPPRKPSVGQMLEAIEVSRGLAKYHARRHKFVR